MYSYLILLNSVAVFDVFSSPRRQEAFVLLQPHHSLSDIFQFDGISDDQLKAYHRPDTAYVGLVQETGSLFMMSNAHYPLVVFGDTEYSPNTRFLDSGPSSDPRKDFPDKVDSVTKRRKLVELCLESPFDTRCLIGKRRLDPPGSSNRQLSSVLSMDLLPVSGNGRDSVQEPQQVTPRPSNNDDTPPPPRLGSHIVHRVKDLGNAPKLSVVTSMLAAIILGTVWIVRNMAPIGRLLLLSEPSSAVVMHTDPSLSLTGASLSHTHNSLSAPNGNAKVGVEDLGQPLLSTTSPVPHRPSVLFAEPIGVQGGLDISIAPTTATENAEESEKEGDTNTTPKKRKAPRRRRGKKGKGGAISMNGPTDDTEKDEPNEGAINGDGAENENPPVSATLSVSSTPISATSSLVVSDSILGTFCIIIYWSELTFFRIRIPWDCCVPGFPSRAPGGCKASTARFRHFSFS